LLNLQGFEVKKLFLIQNALINYFFMKEEIKAYNNVLELIGNTPLIKLNKVTENLEGNFYAKVEAFNPGHSTKDRIALYIIEEAEKRGILSPGDTIIETTSGNTGFSLAMVSIIKGYNCILAVSSKSSKDKIDMLRSLALKYMFALHMFLQMMSVLIIMLPNVCTKKLKVQFTSTNILIN
jgi:cystathionine beta-synthase